MVCCFQRKTWITNTCKRISKKVFKLRSITFWGCLGCCIMTNFVVYRFIVIVKLEEQTGWTVAGLQTTEIYTQKFGENVCRWIKVNLKMILGKRVVRMGSGQTPVPTHDIVEQKAVHFELYSDSPIAYKLRENEDLCVCEQLTSAQLWFSPACGISKPSAGIVCGRNFVVSGLVYMCCILHYVPS